MKRIILWIILIVAAGAAAWGLRISLRSHVSQNPAPGLPQEIPAPQLSADLYPLYAAAHWNALSPERFMIGTTSYSGTSITSDPLSAGMDPGSVITPFDAYYDKKLKMLGWRIANDLAAGGHVGGQTGYRKGTSTILTRFHIDYQVRPENAPTECPCTVTLSLFSTGE